MCEGGEGRQRCCRAARERMFNRNFDLEDGRAQQRLRTKRARERQDVFATNKRCGERGAGADLLLQQRLHDSKRHRVDGPSIRCCRGVAHVGVDYLQLRGIGKGVAAVAEAVEKAA